MFVAMNLAICGCQRPTEIVVRVFHHPPTDADYRVVTVLGGRRVGTPVSAHANPPFSWRQPALAPDLELRLQPLGASPTYDAVCFDVQRRGRWPEGSQTVRICTRFDPYHEVHQDVYFNWEALCIRANLGEVACPIAAPGCTRLSASALRELERATASPPRGTGTPQDTSWGDVIAAPSTASDAPCAYECPSLANPPQRLRP